MSKRKHAISDDSEEETFKVSKFVDVEASEEDNEEEDESLGDFINEIVEEAESEEASEVPESEEASEEASTPRGKKKPEEPEEFARLSKEIEQRYKTAYQQTEMEEVPQQMLLPTDRSPRLWLVRCSPKKEKQIVLAVMRRFITSEHTENPVQISGVLTNEGVKGYIYVEAFQKQQVLQAIDGVAGAFKSNITQVPSKEMTEVLFIPEMDPVLYRTGNFIRVTRGKYAGDIAQIEGPTPEKGMVTLKIVPRILGDEKQKLFSPDDHHPSEIYRISRAAYVFKKETYRGGYLEKDVPTAHLSPTPPASLEEKKWFTEAPSQETAHVSKGEFVEITSGGLKGATGTVAGTEGDQVLIKIGEKKVRVSFAEIKKRYSVGDEVFVISGRKRGKSGFIIGIDHETVRIGASGFSEEIEVKADEIRLGAHTEASASAPERRGAIRPRRDPITDREGVITAGRYKGKRGTVKDAKGDTLRVQLSTNLECVRVEREFFEVQSQPTKYGQGPRSPIAEYSVKRGETTPVQEEGGSTPISYAGQGGAVPYPALDSDDSGGSAEYFS
ncbi:transcription elongation factor SPT5 [Nematocida displodere]|uniref:Chromatin elongation factor SPT5 n=1 Tax=Nematocida displodere TaxID=1805483 RepID=A0A177EH81_9MICR|nr:transcription elongation factor SPT5 [Nematocida displodere]